MKFHMVIVLGTDGHVVAGDVITGSQLKDLNRARDYLRDVAREHGTPVYASVQDAVASLA